MKTPGWVVYLWVAAIFLMAAACGGGTVVEERVQSVSKAVPTQPLRIDQVPLVPTPLPPRPVSDAAAADLLLAKVCELYSYVLQADPLLRLSAGLLPRELPGFAQCEDPE